MHDARACLGLNSGMLNHGMPMFMRCASHEACMVLLRMLLLPMVLLMRHASHEVCMILLLHVSSRTSNYGMLMLVRRICLMKHASQ
jgi:hypothetical protein